MKKVIRSVTITSMMTLGVAKATVSSRLGSASTTSRSGLEPLMAAIRSLIWATHANCPCNSLKRLPTPSTSAGMPSINASAGARINARAAMITANMINSAMADASVLGRPSRARLSASGDRMIVSTKADASGRKTTDPIDRTKGRARKRPMPSSMTNADVRRSSS